MPFPEDAARSAAPQPHFVKSAHWLAADTARRGSMHLICRRGDGVNLNGLSLIDRDGQLYRSVAWELPLTKAKALVDGWVYFHATKRSPSDFGGLVVDVAQLNSFTWRGAPEVAIIFKASPAAQQLPWRGAAHSMAWCSGIVPLTFAHERELP